MERSLSAGDKAQLSEWRDGWRIVLGSGVGIGVGYALFVMVASLFIKPMAEEFGWSRSAVTFAPMVGLIASLLYPVAGMVVDRTGARATALAGLGLMAALYIAFTLLPPSQPLWFAAFLLFGLVTPFTGYVVFLAPVVRQFVRQRGTALALTMCGISAIAAVAIPLLQEIIANAGWRSGYLFLAAAAFVFGLPAILLCLPRGVPAAGERSAAAAAPAAAGDTLGDALRRRDFWLLSLAFVIAALPIGGLVAHSQPLLTDAGFSGAAAAALGSVYALSMIAGRLGAGFLLDRFNPYRVAALFMILPFAGAVILSGAGGLAASVAAVTAALILFGLIQGAEVDFVAFFVARHFGTAHYSLIFGIVIAAVGLAMALGGTGFAWLFDALGNYRAAMIASAAAFILAAAAMLLTDRETAAGKARRSRTALS